MLLAKIEKAWKEREAKVKSLDATWKIETTYKKGTVGTDNKGQVFPENDTTHVTEFRLVCENEKIMWIRTGPEYDITTHQFVDKVVTTAFNGKERRRIWDSESRDRQHAFTRESKTFLEKDSRVSPLLFL